MRTHTPPVLKWLLVERATVAGDIVQLEKRINLLSAELEKRHKTLRALDTTIGLTESRANAKAAGVVRAHTREYGRRGALKEFIVATLRGTTEGLRMREIARRAAEHFAIMLATESELSVFVNSSVKPQMKALKRQELAEVHYEPGISKCVGFWRWKNQIPTLSELAALIATIPQGGPDALKDQFRGEVAGE